MKRARGPGASGPRPYGAALAAVFLLAGCGTPRFASEPAPAADLSGHWVLDPAASDDAASMVAAIIPKPRPLPPRDAPGASYPATPDGGARGGNRGGRGGRGDRSGDSRQQSPGPEPEQAPSWGRVRPADFVSAFALPPPRLDIEQQPALITVGAGPRRREFEPGDERPYSVTDRYGSRRVSAGWLRDVFTVASTDRSRLEVVERFRHRADDRLELEVSFKADGLKSLLIHSVYRRADGRDTEAESAAGPPPPPPR